MPYHSIRRLLAYGPEQSHLKRYLESGFDPNDYHEDLADWLGDEEPDQQWRDEDGFTDDKLYEWVDSAPQARIDEFKAYVEELPHISDGPDRPAYEHMAYSRLVRPTWLVHFTDDPLDIAENGFKYGWESTEGLGLTTHFTDAARKRGAGYNFAFVLGSPDARNASSRDGGGPKYGGHAVVFWADGVEAYHYGDEENQVIFWGPEVVPDRIFAVWNGGDDGWHVQDASGRVVFGADPDVYHEDAAAKDFEDAAEWTVANHRMLSRVEEKRQRRRRERAKAASSPPST